MRVQALALAAGLACGCGGTSPDVLRERAITEWRAGRLDQAEGTLAELSAVRPLTVPERLLRAQVARDRGRLDEAVAALGEPPESVPPEEVATLEATRGTLEVLRHNFRAAEAALGRALAVNPGQAEAVRELINIQAAQGRLDEADASFRALSKLPNAPLTFADLHLWTLGRREDLGPAELAEALRKALANDPGDRDSRLALAENLRRLGSLDEAEAVLAPLDDRDLAALACRARVAIDRGEPDAAQSLVARAPVDGAPPAIARLRGRLALGRGDAEAAALAYRAALTAAPDDRDAFFGLSRALLMAGDADAARPHAQAAEARDRLDWLIQNARPPERRVDPVVLRSIAEACLELGRRDQARAWFRLALAHAPGDADLQRALFRLDADGPDESAGNSRGA